MKASGRNRVDGLLLVDKPPDWTSHDVVACVRSRFGLDKAGHCGTLDPFATGLLMILMGRATRLQDDLMAGSKTYSGTIRLGIATDSQDRTGETIASAEVPALSREELERTAATFLGEQLQLPPMLSAVKIGGRPLYKLARQGRTVERKPRKIEVMEFDLLDIRLPDVSFRLHCSKGTYVRTIAADFGERIGCGAHLRELRRERCGEFQVGEASSMDEVRGWDLSRLQEHAVPFETLAERLRNAAREKTAG